jgi:hypothetical protein
VASDNRFSWFPIGGGTPTASEGQHPSFRISRDDRVVTEVLLSPAGRERRHRSLSSALSNVSSHSRIDPSSGLGNVVASSMTAARLGLVVLDRDAVPDQGSSPPPDGKGGAVSIQGLAQAAAAFGPIGIVFAIARAREAMRPADNVSIASVDVAKVKLKDKAQLLMARTPHLRGSIKPPHGGMFDFAPASSKRGADPTERVTKPSIVDPSPESVVVLYQAMEDTEPDTTARILADDVFVGGSRADEQTSSVLALGDPSIPSQQVLVGELDPDVFTVLTQRMGGGVSRSPSPTKRPHSARQRIALSRFRLPVCLSRTSLPLEHWMLSRVAFYQSFAPFLSGKSSSVMDDSRIAREEEKKEEIERLARGHTSHLSSFAPLTKNYRRVLTLHEPDHQPARLRTDSTDSVTGIDEDDSVGSDHWSRRNTWNLSSAEVENDSYKFACFPLPLFDVLASVYNELRPLGEAWPFTHLFRPLPCLTKRHQLSSTDLPELPSSPVKATPGTRLRRASGTIRMFGMLGRTISVENDDPSSSLITEAIEQKEPFVSGALETGAGPYPPWGSHGADMEVTDAPVADPSHDTVPAAWPMCLLALWAPVPFERKLPLCMRILRGETSSATLQRLSQSGASAFSEAEDAHHSDMPANESSEDTKRERARRLVRANREREAFERLKAVQVQELDALILVWTLLSLPFALLQPTTKRPSHANAVRVIEDFVTACLASGMDPSGHKLASEDSNQRVAGSLSGELFCLYIPQHVLLKEALAVVLGVKGARHLSTTARSLWVTATTGKPAAVVEEKPVLLSSSPRADISPRMPPSRGSTSPHRRSPRPTDDSLLPEVREVDEDSLVELHHPRHVVARVNVEEWKRAQKQHVEETTRAHQRLVASLGEYAEVVNNVRKAKRQDRVMLSSLVDWEAMDAAQARGREQTAWDNELSDTAIEFDSRWSPRVVDASPQPPTILAVPDGPEQPHEASPPPASVRQELKVDTESTSRLVPWDDARERESNHSSSVLGITPPQRLRSAASSPSLRKIPSRHDHVRPLQTSRDRLATVEPRAVAPRARRKSIDDLGEAIGGYRRAVLSTVHGYLGEDFSRPRTSHQRVPRLSQAGDLSLLPPHDAPAPEPPRTTTSARDKSARHRAAVIEHSRRQEVQEQKHALRLQAILSLKAAVRRKALARAKAKVQQENELEQRKKRRKKRAASAKPRRPRKNTSPRPSVAPPPIPAPVPQAAPDPSTMRIKAHGYVRADAVVRPRSPPSPKQSELAVAPPPPVVVIRKPSTSTAVRSRPHSAVPARAFHYQRKFSPPPSATPTVATVSPVPFPERRPLTRPHSARPAVLPGKTPSVVERWKRSVKRPAIGLDPKLLDLGDSAATLNPPPQVRVEPDQADAELMIDYETKKRLELDALVREEEAEQRRVAARPRSAFRTSYRRPNGRQEASNTSLVTPLIESSVAPPLASTSRAIRRPQAPPSRHGMARSASIRVPGLPPSLLDAATASNNRIVSSSRTVRQPDFG